MFYDGRTYAPDDNERSKSPSAHGKALISVTVLWQASSGVNE